MTVYKAQIKGLYGGARSWSTAYHFNSTAGAAAVLTTLVTNWTNLWTTATNGYENYANADVTCTQALVYTLSAANRTTNVNTSPLSLAGTSASASLPFQTCPLLFLTGANDTKSDRGHMFLPTVAENAFASDFLTAGFLTSMQTVFNAFFTAQKSLSGYSVFSWNRLTNKLGEPPWTQHVLTTYLLNNKLATRRKRTRKTVATSSVTGSL